MISTADGLARPSWLSKFYEVFAPWHSSQLVLKNYEEVTVQDYSAVQIVRRLWDKKTSLRSAKRLTIQDHAWMREFMTHWQKYLFQKTDIYCKPSRSDVHFFKMMSQHSEPLRLAIDELKKKLTVRRKYGQSGYLVSELRSVAGLDAEALKTYLSSIHPQHITEKAVNGRVLNRHIDANALGVLQQYLEGTLHLMDAAEHMCCPSLLLLALTRIEVIPCERLAVKPRSPRFHKAILDEWMGVIRNNALTVKLQPRNVRALSVIAAHRTDGVLRPPWIKLMRSIQARNVVLYALDSKAGLSGIFVCKSDLKEFGFRTSDFAGLKRR
ncbi:hypothetical protein [Herminiimonas aquatilis]|uniref:hypothetical protein n=1 Tax=Herminiimonas aquatilis TaxID=345342 RepID=UPI0036D2BD58